MVTGRSPAEHAGAPVRGVERSTASDRVTVVNISGYSRSGSTLLSRMLGELPGCVAAGEVWHIWRRSFGQDERCGCGRPFRACEFWVEVVRQAFGDIDGVDAERIARLQASLQFQARPLASLWPTLRSESYRARLAEYESAVTSLYAAIHRISGARVIVDSTKIPSNALLLTEMEAIDLHVVHLIRDSRATAHSWQRAKIRPSLSPRQVAFGWMGSNLLIRQLRRRFETYQLLRYEDFVRAPDATIVNIASRLGISTSAPEERGARTGTVDLPVHHTISGNPNRFATGEVVIAPDDEWRTEMPGGQKGLVFAVTWPLLWRYGYLAKPSIAHADRRTAR